MRVRCFCGISRESSSPRFVCSIRTDSGLEAFLSFIPPSVAAVVAKSVGASLRLSAAKLDACFFKKNKNKHFFAAQYRAFWSCAARRPSRFQPGSSALLSWTVHVLFCFFPFCSSANPAHSLFGYTCETGTTFHGTRRGGGVLLSVQKAESFLLSPSSCHFKALYELSRDGRSAFFTLD